MFIKIMKLIIIKKIKLFLLKKKFDFSEVNKEKKNFILICSKYEYIFKTDNEITEMIKNLQNYIKNYTYHKKKPND